MDLDDYLLVRRKAAETLRSGLIDPRVSFEEAALLCHLSLADGPLRSSALASYAGVIRPTMSHRLQRLARLGLLERTRGEGDRRSVLYGIAAPGRWIAEDLLEAMALSIEAPDPLAHVSPERLGRYVEAAGTVPAGGADLVLLALWDEGRPLQVTEVQRRSGLLQNTCSMAIVSLVSRGLVDRSFDDGDLTGLPGDPVAETPVANRPARLTVQGGELAERLADRVARAVVHR